MINNINICAFLEQFNREYDYLYDHHDHVAGYDEAVDSFDAFLKDKANASFVREFAAYRGDVVSSDREAAAFMFALRRVEWRERPNTLRCGTPVRTS